MRVALVTVGDELLAGDTVNTNAAWLGERLTERGATVERVTVVPDRIGEIARVVNEYRAEYDAVVVTGGLGPTHDDVTMDGVAAAFGREVTRSEEALAWLEEYGGYSHEDLAEGTADIPAGAEMLPNREGVAPGCVLGSVYVLPGVPDEMKTMFEAVADRFSGERRHVETVEADEPESALLTRIRDVRDRFDVKVGSYPGETVEIKLESTDETEVREAAAWLADRVEKPEKE
ncbi:competence/damage-inducible protein A [Halorientalis regularis]|jgi:molybdenum cofactor synthesis domain-containing protein|uniref:Molybdenum cofactor synthesis domain-containing protein n=1 Tax=Halorientalis regularis TaxID=660518 RepID=A0A1G7Q8I9_9EURY|nr:molybdopterin-binding protein [Halorientalis regularis]SDF94841.1 molybdenum cofactor synthesis domain-containing protein [Halorientalis regularis]